MKIKVTVTIDEKTGVQTDSVEDAIRMMALVEQEYNPTYTRGSESRIVSLYMDRVARRYREAGGLERIDTRTPETFLISCVGAGLVRAAVIEAATS